jgi:hypothetical protein
MHGHAIIARFLPGKSDKYAEIIRFMVTIVMQLPE